MNKLTKKIGFDENSQPPKDQIGYRGEGKFYEYKNREGVLAYDIASSCDSSESNNYSTIYNIRANEITNPKEGDITVVPDSGEEFTVEPTTTEDNGYTIKTYDVTYQGAESRIKVTSNPTMFSSSYIDSESPSSHNSGSVSELGSIFHVGTISISLGKSTQENEEFPEVHMYKEIKGETKEYVNGEGVNRGETVLADGNQTNSSAKDYIKNKPYVPFCYRINGSVSTDEFTPDVLETVTFESVQDDFDAGAIISLVYDGKIDMIVYDEGTLLKTSQGVVGNNVGL